MRSKAALILLSFLVISVSNNVVSILTVAIDNTIFYGKSGYNEK